MREGTMQGRDAGRSFVRPSAGMPNLKFEERA
jgi:hypothetical protein